MGEKEQAEYASCHILHHEGALELSHEGFALSTRRKQTNLKYTTDRFCFAFPTALHIPSSSFIGGEFCMMDFRKVKGSTALIASGIRITQSSHDYLLLSVNSLSWVNMPFVYSAPLAWKKIY